MVEMPVSAELLVSDRTRIAVPGLLEPFAVGLRAELTLIGFTRQVVTKHTHLLFRFECLAGPAWPVYWRCGQRRDRGVLD